MIAPTRRDTTETLRLRERADVGERLAVWALGMCALTAVGCSTPRDEAASEPDTDAGVGGKTMVDAAAGTGGSSTGRGTGGGTISSGSGGAADASGSGGRSGSGASSGGNGSGGNQNNNGSGGNQNNNGSGGNQNNGTGGLGSGGTASGGQSVGTGGTASGGMMMASTGGAASGGMMMAASTGGHGTGGQGTGGQGTGGMMMAASTGGHGTGGQGTGGQGTGGMMMASTGGSNPCGSNSCSTPPSNWTIGMTVNSGSACPSGYSGTTTTLHSGTPKVSCSGGSCKCGPAPGSGGTGFCQQNFQLRVAADVNYLRPARSDKTCYQLLADTVTDDTISVYEVYAFQPFYVACSGSSCPTECGAMVSSAPALSATWDSSVDFCALSSTATSCGSGGKCTSGKLCLMAAGNQSCPSGFTPQGSAGGWYTGASGSPSCGCGGCGSKTAANCGISVTEFYDQTCSSSTYLGYFDYGSALTIYDVDWPARGLAATMDPPLPGTCDAPQVTSTGSFAATGQTTICCD